MFFSKRALSLVSRVSRCCGDNSSSRLSMFRPFFSFMFDPSGGHCVFVCLLCGLSLCSYLLAVSMPFGVHPSIHPHLPMTGEYACGPFFPSHPESGERLLAPPLQTP